MTRIKQMIDDGIIIKYFCKVVWREIYWFIFHQNSIVIFSHIFQGLICNSFYFRSNTSSAWYNFDFLSSCQLQFLFPKQIQRLGNIFKSNWVCSHCEEIFLHSYFTWNHFFCNFGSLKNRHFDLFDLENVYNFWKLQKWSI